MLGDMWGPSLTVIDRTGHDGSEVPSAIIQSKKATPSDLMAASGGLRTIELLCAGLQGHLGSARSGKRHVRYTIDTHIIHHFNTLRKPPQYAEETTLLREYA